MLISVCIPTYNRLADLQQCVASVMAAADILDEPVEVVVSDNASPDGTREWLAGFESHNKNVEFVHWTNPENIGAISNVKLLIERAKGEYLFFLTDDDLVLPNALSLVRDCIAADSPLFIKTAITTYLTKSKRCSYYAADSNIRDNVDRMNFLAIEAFSHVFSGCVVRNTPAILDCLRASRNAYPSMEMCALNAGDCMFLAEPVVFHQWENDIFWDMDVDMSTQSAREKQLNRDAQLALLRMPDNFFEGSQVDILYQRLLERYGYIEQSLISKFGRSAEGIEVRFSAAQRKMRKRQAIKRFVGKIGSLILK